MDPRINIIKNVIKYILFFILLFDQTTSQFIKERPLINQKTESVIDSQLYQGIFSTKFKGLKSMTLYL